MGTTFMNIHVRRSNTVDVERVGKCLSTILEKKGYLPTETSGDDTVSFALVTSDASQWITVCPQEGFAATPADMSSTAAELSELTGEAVLGTACIDSDLYYMNLLHPTCGVDVWAHKGYKDYIPNCRRTVLAEWKPHVSDATTFNKAMREKYVCAEDIAMPLVPVLGLPAEHNTAVYENLMKENAVRLHFKVPVDASVPPVTLKFHYFSEARPIHVNGDTTIISCLNHGKGSKGLELYFVGNYVENEEITFSDVEIYVDDRKPCRTPEELMAQKPLAKHAVTLQKVNLPNMGWVYHSSLPDFIIPPAVSEALPPAAQFQLQMRRQINLSFKAHGNPRKALDIQFHLVPHENPDGQFGWNIWYRYGSKAAYIQAQNESTESFLADFPPEIREEYLARKKFSLLDPNDYD